MSDSPSSLLRLCCLWGRQKPKQQIKAVGRNQSRHLPSFVPKSFICFDLGEMIFCNETDRRWFFIHLGTNRARDLLLVVDGLYKHRQWVPSFPITPSHPHHRLLAGAGSLRQTVHLMKVCKFISQRLQEPRRESFSNYLLLNQFTGRELRAQLGDYCYGEAGALIACLSNLTNTPGAGSQIER